MVGQRDSDSPIEYTPAEKLIGLGYFIILCQKKITNGHLTKSCIIGAM
jgi:hypothetical protein